jgi:hypothetical protein
MSFFFYAFRTFYSIDSPQYVTQIMATGNVGQERDQYESVRQRASVTGLLYGPGSFEVCQTCCKAPVETLGYTLVSCSRLSHTHPVGAFKAGKCPVKGILEQDSIVTAVEILE